LGTFIFITGPSLSREESHLLRVVLMMDWDCLRWSLSPRSRPHYSGTLPGGPQALSSFCFEAVRNIGGLEISLDGRGMRTI